jgi:hypothetical protein
VRPWLTGSLALALLTACKGEPPTPSTTPEPGSKPGDAAASDAPSPEPAPTPPRFAHLQASESGGCVERIGQGVWCWGVDLAAETPLGVGYPVDLGHEGPLSSLALERKLCASTESGQLRCVSRYEATAVPAKSPDSRVLLTGDRECELAGETLDCGDGDVLDGVVDADAEAHLLCALRHGDEVWCARRGERLSEAKYRVIVDDAVAIAVGDDVYCVIDDEARVRCPEGKVPRGYMRLRDGPTYAPVPGLEDVVELEVAAGHGCARDSGGKVLCFGENHWGQLGAGDTSTHAEPVEVELPGPAVEISVSASQSCAALVDRVLCWGTHGVSFREQSGERHGFEFESEAVFADESLSCARKADDSLWCWGSTRPSAIDDRFGGLLAGAQPREARIPVRVDAFETASLRSGDELFFIYLTDDLVLRLDEVDTEWRTRGVSQAVDDFDLLCFIRTRGRALECVQVDDSVERVRWLPRLSGVTHFDLAGVTICAVVGGRVRCSEAGSRWTEIPELRKVEEVTTDELGTGCARMSDGSVACWVADTLDGYRVEEGPTQMPLPELAADIEVNNLGLLVHMRDGAVGLIPDIYTPELAPRIDNGVLEMAVGTHHACARVDGDGDGDSERITCFGSNRVGQLGTVGEQLMLEPTAISFPET